MKTWLVVVIASGLFFLLGLLAGDLSAGKLNPTIFGLSAVGASLIPIGGVAAQIYADERRSEGTSLREKREVHAQRIVDESLLPLCSVEFFGRDGDLGYVESATLPLAVDYGGQGGKRYVQGLRFWKYALEHIKADAGLDGSWAKLEELGARWNHQKFELDRLFLIKAKAAARDVLGDGFAIAPDWIDPPPAKWFNAARLADWLRRGFLDFTIKEATQEYPAAPGREKSSRYVYQNGPYIFFRVDAQGVVTPEKCALVYSKLASDEELVEALKDLRATESQLGGFLPGFIDSAWDFCQSVEASLRLPGTCGVCREFVG